MDFDPTILNQMKSDLDTETVKEILASYLQEAPQLLAEARAAIKAKRLADFERAAHTLKSTSANVGAMRLSAAAKALEIQARQGQLPVDDGPIADLARLLDSVAPTLRAWSG